LLHSKFHEELTGCSKSMPVEENLNNKPPK
jgi:hypothetical protein